MSDGRGRRYAVHGGQATIFKQRFLIGLSVVQRLSNLQSVIFIMRASAPTLFKILHPQNNFLSFFSQEY